jgi:dTMP kinase
MTGKFITFEGIDGAGKSTHIESVRAFLVARGKTVVMTREPGGTELGEAVRGLFLGRSMSPHTEALLVFAARREHLEQVVWPALVRGDWVLCDRFTDATYAYQGGGRELGAERISALAEWVHPKFSPDLTLSEAVEFHRRVRDIYLQRAQNEPDRIKVLSSEQSKDTVRSRVLVCAQQLLAGSE